VSCSTWFRSQWTPPISGSRASGARRAVWPSIAGVAISALLLWWVVGNVEWAAVRAHIGSASVPLLLAAVAIATATFALRLLRWRLLLRRDDGSVLPLPPLWHAVAIGFMANNVLPFRMGEIVRTLTVSRLAPVRFTAAFSSIAVERVFDGLTVVALLALSLFTAGLPDGASVGGAPLARVAAAGGAVMSAALLVAVAVVAWPLAAERVIRRIVPGERLAGKLVGLVEGVRHGLSVLRSPGRLAAVVAWSLVLWLVNGLSFYVAFLAFDIPIGFSAALLLQGVLVLGITVPSTPGYVGVFEGAIKAALLLFAVDPHLAVAYAVTYHVTTFMPIVLLGAWSLLSTSLSLRELREAPSP
jgi:uncharacterized protein (TIRG00374 family)